MLKISIELIPMGMALLGAEEIGMIEISNDGTCKDPEIGHYDVILYKRLGKNRGNRKSREVWKRGRVENFPRQLGPYELLRRALNNAMET